jgi:hypothetical protein
MGALKMAEHLAPDGKIWKCLACGKTTKNKYENENGWDEACVLNCVLIPESSLNESEKP